MKTLNRSIFILLCIALMVLSAFAQPRYDDYDDYSDDYDHDRQLDQLERERKLLRRERNQLDYERRQLEDSQLRPPPPVPAQRAQESCPAGFSPSENKCSPQERQRGCKDMRLPGGLGCVKR